MTMPRPTVSDRILSFLALYGHTQADLAEAMDVSRDSVNALATGRRALTALMAVRLEIATGTPAETWLEAQQAEALEEARQSPALTAVLPLTMED